MFLCFFHDAMNLTQSTILLVFAFLAVFGESALSGFRTCVGAQPDLLPALMVYAALNLDIWTVSALAVLGGVGFDTFSANSLGISILPLLLVGILIFARRDLILRSLPFAQSVLGGAASAIVPALTLILLLNGGRQPLLGWGSLWQWSVMVASGAAATPVLFVFFDRCHQALGYPPAKEFTFRSDREILRDRNKWGR